MSDFPATCDAHWASGPVPCCDKHAQGLVALGRFMGAHVPLTKLTEPAQCTNCINEAGVAARAAVDGTAEGCEVDEVDD